MSWVTTLFSRVFLPSKGNYNNADAIIIDIPAELYYKELALYSVTSLIGNAISRSEIKCFEENVPVRNSDYYRLNVSPNKNETSSVFWHKVINNVIRHNSALVVESNSYLYCADSYCVKDERPILGDTYSDVTIGNFTFKKNFGQQNTYLFKLNNEPVRELIDGMYDEYSKILQSAAKAFRRAHSSKYKIHINGLKAGDKEFEKEFNEIIKKQLSEYLKNEDAIYPEFDGYDLKHDDSINNSYAATDFITLKKDLFETFSTVFHIPLSMMTGNINNMGEIVASFLSFGVDPYADMINEALNKGVGEVKYINGTYYKVDTSYINHRDLFDLAAGISNLISSGTCCIDEIREFVGLPLLNNDFGKKHFITKNFDELENFCSSLSKNEGGE